jgi:hypothetical protein
MHICELHDSGFGRPMAFHNIYTEDNFKTVRTTKFLTETVVFGLFLMGNGWFLNERT